MREDTPQTDSLPRTRCNVHLTLVTQVPSEDRHTQACRDTLSVLRVQFGARDLPAKRLGLDEETAIAAAHIKKPARRAVVCQTCSDARQIQCELPCPVPVVLLLHRARVRIMVAL